MGPSISRWQQETKLSLGAYPAVSLAEARTKARIEAGRRAVGLDVRQTRRDEEEKRRVESLNTFELLARAWHGQAQKDPSGQRVRREGSASLGDAHRIKDRGNLETA